MTNPSLTITPVPTEEEAAAIMAAMTVLWPAPAVTPVRRTQSTAWRFADRWWHAQGRFGR